MIRPSRAPGWSSTWTFPNRPHANFQQAKSQINNPGEMAVFKKHYTREEARQLLPLVREWLEELSRTRDLLQGYEERINKGLESGNDLGGGLINKYVKCLADAKEIVLRFAKREIQVKDLNRGLIDFPAYIGGKEVFLCWEKGEEDIEFWHDLTSGYAGREPL